MSLGTEGGLWQTIRSVPWPGRPRWLAWNSAAAVWRPVNYGRECLEYVANCLSALWRVAQGRPAADPHEILRRHQTSLEISQPDHPFWSGLAKREDR